MNKFSRNESAQTLPRSTQSLTFQIFHQGRKEPLVLSFKGSDTVGTLIDAIRERLKYEHIIGVCSRDGFYTLDYYLQYRENRLVGIHNNQCLQVIFEGIVADYSTPTLADFEFLSCVGEGISAAVYLVRHCSNGKLYALKMIKKEYFREYKTLESVLREKKILSEMIHDLPFVTRLEAAFESYRHLNFLLEFYPGGEFFYHLSQMKLTEDQAKIFFAEILLTMEQLHKRKILYRDLKPENIMVDFEGHLHLGDFGLCRINLEREDMAHTQCGSPEYMAYETREAVGYGYAADFYTMGAIIYEMVRGVPPFYHDSPLDFTDVSQSFKELVLALIERDQLRRLANFNEIKRSRWLREIDWDKIPKKIYKMPTRLNIYEVYIHDEFLSKEVINEALKEEQPYDRLLDMFFYLNRGKGAIAEFYPSLKGKKEVKSKIKREKSEKSDNKSHHSKSRSKNNSKTREVKFKDPISTIKRRNVKENTNIYLVNQPLSQSEREKHDNSKRSVSKNKHISPISTMTMKSPVKFNKISGVKSATDLKSKQFSKEIISQSERNGSKKKKM